MSKHLAEWNGTGIGYIKSIGPEGAFTTRGSKILGSNGLVYIANSDVAKGSAVDLTTDPVSGAGTYIDDWVNSFEKTLQDYRTAVTYKMFGAKLNGVLGEDDAAVQATHEYANLHNFQVIADKGTYKPAAHVNIPVNTDVDWSKLIVVFDDTNLKDDGWSTDAVFYYAGEPESILVADYAALKTAGLVAGQTVINEMAALGQGIYHIDTTHFDVYRDLGSVGPKYRKAMVSLHANGKVSKPFGLDILPDTINAVTRIKPNAPINIRLPEIQVSGAIAAAAKGHQLINIEYAQEARITGGRVFVDCPVQRVGRLIHTRLSGSIYIDGVYADARPSPNSQGNYILQYDQCLLVDINNLDTTGGWGALGGNYISDIRVTNSKVNRVDIHWQVGNITVSNTELTENAIVFAGLYGTTLIERVKKYISATSSRRMVELRPDYGGVCFKGSKIIIKHSDIQVTDSGSVVLLDLPTSNNFGSDSYIPDVYIKNVSFYGVQDEAITLSLFGANMVTDETNVVYLPSSIVLEQVDLTYSPNALGRHIRFDRAGGAYPYRCVKGNKGGTATNMDIMISNVINESNTIKANLGSIEIVDSPTDYTAGWTGENGPYPEIVIEDSQKISVCLTLPRVKLKAIRSELIYNDVVHSSTFGASGEIQLDYCQCDIKPQRVDGTSAQVIHYTHTYFDGCNFYPQYALDGTTPLTKSIASAKGFANTNVLNAPYTGAIEGFFTTIKEYVDNIDSLEYDAGNIVKTAVPAALEAAHPAATDGLKARRWVFNIDPTSVGNGELTANYYMVTNVSDGATNTLTWVETV